MVYAVIMAGGSGTRFWPKSTSSLPKQFLNLFGDGTMIQNTAKRIEDIIPQERIIVVTNEKYVSIVRDQLPKVPQDNIVGEPVAKNTAPCVAIAAELIRKKDPNGVMVVLPADHHITEPEKFTNILSSAVSKAESGDFLVTIGVEPSRPETGFGYIHSDSSSKEELGGNSVLTVKAFTEKPNEVVAKQFVESGDYFWNSGMFIWKAETVLKEIATQLPAMYEELEQSSVEFFGSSHNAAVNDFYYACESISIDYGIMENAQSVYVVPGDFGWNDVGSWTAVYELAKKDSQGNSVQTLNATFADTTNSLVLSSGEKMISVVGLDNVAVVETEDAILVCNLDKAQGVKEIVDQLKGSTDFKRFV